MHGICHTLLFWRSWVNLYLSSISIPRFWMKKKTKPKNKTKTQPKQSKVKPNIPTRQILVCILVWTIVSKMRFAKSAQKSLQESLMAATLFCSSPKSNWRRSLVPILRKTLPLLPSLLSLCFIMKGNRCPNRLNHPCNLFFLRMKIWFSPRENPNWADQKNWKKKQKGPICLKRKKKNPMKPFTRHQTISSHSLTKKSCKSYKESSSSSNKESNGLKSHYMNNSSDNRFIFGLLFQVGCPPMQIKIPMDSFLLTMFPIFPSLFPNPSPQKNDPSFSNISFSATNIPDALSYVL